MRSFKRVHDTGTETVISEHQDVWRIQIYLNEPNHIPTTVVGYLAKTVELAKTIADQEVLRLGHVCNAACKDWRQVQPKASIALTNRA
jgi:hypothetical protein